MKIAAIDLGSNSLHLVIADVDPDGRIHVLDRARERVRLGRGDMRRLNATSMEKGLRTLRGFRLLMTRLGVERYRAVATSAVREAVNGGTFLLRVEREVGLRVRVIPGREEARLIHLGVSHGIDLGTGPCMILDAGGGSIETILADGGRPVALESRKLGVERLRHRFLADGSPSREQVARLERHVKIALEDVLEAARALGVRRLVVTSGTLLSVMQVAARLTGRETASLHNLTVPRPQVREACRRLTRFPHESVDARRADLTVAGAVLAGVVLDRVRPASVTACAWALREGVLLDYVRRHRKTIEEAEQVPDARRRGVLRLARHLGYDLGHGQHVASLALRLFDQLVPELNLGRQERDWLEWAAMLHDVGHVIAHENHHRHSQYLITRGDLLGFDPEEREVVGWIALYHRKGAPRASDEGYGELPRKQQRAIRALCAVLRVADALDRSRFKVVRDVAVRRRNGHLSLSLQTGGQDSQLELWEATRRAELLAKVTGRAVSIRVARVRA